MCEPKELEMLNALITGYEVMRTKSRPVPVTLETWNIGQILVENIKPGRDTRKINLTSPWRRSVKPRWQLRST